MTMTALKKSKILKVGQLKMTYQQLKRWKRNRIAFDNKLDNAVIDKSLEEIRKCIEYFEKNKLNTINL